jgi:hypothetical protein
LDILFDDDFIQIRINRENRYIEYQLKQVGSSDKFKLSMEQVFKYICETGCNKLLPIIDPNITLSEEASMWAESEWMPRLIKIGVRTYAIVNPKLEIGCDSLDKINALLMRRDSGITTLYFNNVLKARAWIARY